MKLLQTIYYWLYSLQLCRVGTNVHSEHNFFGRRFTIIGRFRFSLKDCVPFLET